MILYQIVGILIVLVLLYYNLNSEVVELNALKDILRWFIRLIVYFQMFMSFCVLNDDFGIDNYDAS